MNKRYLGALTLIPLLVLLFLGGWFLRITTLFLALRALYEYFHVLSVKGHNPSRALGYLALLGYYALLFTREDAAAHLGIFVAVLTAAAFVLMVFRQDTSIQDAALTVTGFLYAGGFFGFLILLENRPSGIIFVYSVFVISWVCDTLAYYTGRLFGRHKLIERVSPKKTVEGAIGGLLGGALGAYLLGMATTAQTGIAPGHFLVMGFFGAMFGQIGDLAASAIKRYAGEKDYPKLIPGHGGVLDRFDSILFVGVLVYAYVTYIL